MLACDSMMARSPIAPRLLAVALAALGCRTAGDRTGSTAPRGAYGGASPGERTYAVLLVTTNDRFLEQALLANERFTLEKLTPNAFDAKVAARALPRYDAIVLDDHTPSALPPPPVHLLYFHPQGDRSPFPILDQRLHPKVTAPAPNHAVWRSIDVEEVRIDTANAFVIDRARGDIALANAGTEPVIAARRTPSGNTIACGFRLADSDMGLSVALPLFLDNAIEWLASD